MKAAAASMETMLEYGMMKNLDETCRNQYREQSRMAGPPLAEGEAVLLETLGSYYVAEGIYRAWRPGVFYLTSERLFLFHRLLGKVFLSVPLAAIQGVAAREGKNEELYLCLEGRRIVRLRAREHRELARLLEAKLGERGCRFENEFDTSPLDGPAAGITAEGERVTHHSRMWRRPEGSKSWKAGHLYLTNRRLCWWEAFRQELALDIAVDKITAATVETHPQGRILDVIHENGQGRAVACFIGKELWAWQSALRAVVEGRQEIESCPGCGQEDRGFEFLPEGCCACGWGGPKLEPATV